MSSFLDHETASIIIVGAGPVGLSLALGLARQGVNSVVLEKKTALSEHSKALLVTTRTLEILREWKALEPFVEEAGLRSSVSVYLAGNAQPQATLDFAALRDATAVSGVVILPQNRTEALLLKQLRATGHCEVFFEHELTGFSQDENGVMVEVQHNGHRKIGHGSYLVGCDGAHSAVREQLGWHLHGKTYKTRIALADVRVAGARGDVLGPRVAPQPRGALAAIPFPPHYWRIIATLAPGESDEGALASSTIAEHVERLFGTRDFKCVWSSVFRIHCRTSPHFRLQRVLLAGDAAHLNSPVGGQGMNAGIQDTHNLAWKLARALEGGDAQALLASYEQERRGAVLGTVERFTDFLTRFILTPPPIVRAVLLRAAQLAVKQPFVARAVMLRLGMLNTRYGASKLLVPEQSAANLVGCLAPDGEIVNAAGEPSHLRDLAGRDAVLLLFDDGRLPGWNTTELRASLAEVPHLQVFRLLPSRAVAQNGDWRDSTGSIWKRWRATGNTAALIRPDGYIGWMEQRPSSASLRRGVQRALGNGR